MRFLYKINISVFLYSRVLDSSSVIWVIPLLFFLDVIVNISNIKSENLMAWDLTNDGKHFYFVSIKSVFKVNVPAAKISQSYQRNANKELLHQV